MMINEKAPPYDDEAERATLGALMLDNNTVDTALQYLRPDSFYSGANKRIFQAIIDLFNQGHTPDILTVKDKLTQRYKFERRKRYEHLFIRGKRTHNSQFGRMV
jgi:replicative DNA helicase